MQTPTDTQLGTATGFGYLAECEDSSLDETKKIRTRCCYVSLQANNAPPRYHGGAEGVKQKLHDLDQAMLRLRDERGRQRREAERGRERRGAALLPKPQEILRPQIEILGQRSD
jgi:hypothetical protein